MTAAPAKPLVFQFLDAGDPIDPATDNPVIQMHAQLEAKLAAQPEAAHEGVTAFESAPFGGVPRISIHMFCELGETAQMGEAALRDRRLARAAGTIFTGGMPAALARYAIQPTPTLVVVESLDGGEQLLADLDRLAEVCDASTKVMIVGRANDIGLYRELVRRGVSEYLVGPLEPLQLIGAVSALYEDPAAPFTGRSVAVIGAKGGVGASTIAHNLAFSISEKIEANTILVDLDLPFGAAGLNLNQDPLQGVANALAQPDRLDPVLLERMMARCSDRLSLFAAPATLDDDYEIGAAAYAEVTDKIKGSAPFVVLDMPHLWSAWVRHTLLTADEAVVVATPDLTSLRNAKNLIELLVAGRPNDDPPRLVLNMTGLPGRPEISAKDFAEAVGVQPALVLGFDAKLFGQAANNGQMLEEVNAKAKATEGINALARLVSRREAGKVSAKTVATMSALAGLFKRKG
jgi:pilus assembly protein CpaE